MKTLLAVGLAGFLAGCADEDKPDHVYRGSPETGWVEVTPPSRTQAVLNGLDAALDTTAKAAGDYGRGYSAAYDRYRYQNPQPVYQAPPIVPGLRTATIWQDGVPTTIFY